MQGQGKLEITEKNRRPVAQFSHVKIECDPDRALNSDRLSTLEVLIAVIVNSEYAMKNLVTKHLIVWLPGQLSQAESDTYSMEKGDVDEDGVPFVTVVFDGGWSKWSYGHNYNAASEVVIISLSKLICGGSSRKKILVAQPLLNSSVAVVWWQVAVIIGQAISKLLFMGIHNKYCCICERATRQNVTARPHICYKNWDKCRASTSMEQDILVKGFKNSIGDNVEDLIKDLNNDPYHVFGEHSDCRNYFFSKENTNSSIEPLKTSKMFDQVESLVNRLVVKAPILIEDKTSNKGKFYRSLLAKYNAGKQINFTQRGSFKCRCTVARIRFQKDHSWKVSPFKKLTGRSLGMVHNTLLKRVHQHVTATCRKLEYAGTEKKVKCQKIFAPADEDYGPDSEEPENISEVQKSELFQKTLSVTAEGQDHIVQQTTGQSDCKLWHNMRRIRLTASNYRAVCRIKETTSCSSIVKQLLYKPPLTKAATEYGRTNEWVAIRHFQQETGLAAEKRGLFVDLTHGFLGASPDGLVKNENSLIEMKCVPSAIRIEKDGKLYLKKTHKYFYQVQGMLNISGRDTCYLVVMSDLNENLHIEKIYKDVLFWEKKMVPKLHRFYVQCLLPEIVEPNVSRGKIIREPKYILKAQEKLKSKVCVKKQN
ncbi:hypothetical protein PR048_005606 [Dryococelus australis]|uniref:YqaJ viral recombinase domain-containing protein n=1 Tax=Dryococelus australis TaxID=614101 RepID=A0ABQ9I8M3_9NEOP|nr:hypothetical protein PR048_005606 [Dryococelus australis]